jgi:hypothetical protein
VGLLRDDEELEHLFLLSVSVVRMLFLTVEVPFVWAVTKKSWFRVGVYNHRLLTTCLSDHLFAYPQTRIIHS